MKVFKKLAVIILAALMVLSAVACTGGGGKKNPTPVDQTGALTPEKSITKLADITNYGAKTDYTKGKAVTYGDTSAEVQKLADRIDSKKEDAQKADASSIIKIFAASDAQAIVDAMETANLPEDKMKKTVDYMAGSTDVTEEQIESVVESGVFDKQKTVGWSFFDDWSYYEKLDDRAKNSNNSVDDDNVKRQYRNILGKVFAIEMTGDQFARLAVHELVYATSVVEKMASESGIANAELTIETTITDFDQYCQRELDYETLVYLRAFNEYYNFNGANNGLENCVELYGYYYEYNKTDYYSQSDEEFEKQLEYGHKSTFTEAEWLDYVDLQRSSYLKAYRYGDAFYTTFYQKHFSFQEKVEKQEEIVYAIDKWNNLSYTSQMRQAIADGGMIGQLNFSDWLWCYAGDKQAMIEYNEANTAYEEGKDSPVAENRYNGEFLFDMAQLKATRYMLTNVGSLNLGRTLRFQVYSYSGEMAKSAQGYKKDSALVMAEKITPDEATRIIDGLDAEEQKNYAEGKIGVILGQMQETYSKVAVEEKASMASQQPWDAMKTEVNAAIEKDYSVYNKAKDKVEALEDMVIKRNWSCGGVDDEICPKYGNLSHVDCTKEYDTSHNISKFASNYEVILRHMAGSVKVTFQNDVTTGNTESDKYNIEEYPSGTTYKYECGFHGKNFTGKEVTSTMLAKISRKNIKEISLNSGKSFTEGIADLGGEDESWWTNTTPGKENSVASKDNQASVTEINKANNVSGTYSYTYTFAGWYLDADLKYKFDPDDKLSCDLTLYAGYNVEKRG